MENNVMEIIRTKKAFICDMDGVIYHGNKLLPGALEFVDWLQREEKRFLFLTNSSERAPRELQEKLKRLGIEVDQEHFYTSALATAAFVASQAPGCSAYIIGETGLSNALYDAGIAMNDVNPEYVIVGESRVPATGALISPIEQATGNKAYFVGKPNPLMMRTALKKIRCRREDTVIVGDRMDTDIIAGVESEISTVLVLSGCTTREEVKAFAYRPDYILDGVGDLPG